MTKKTKGKIGSSFEGFLKEEGIYEAVTAIAEKRVIAWQIEEAMKAQKITKQKMAIRMNTSRTQVDRLLDPKNDKVSLETIHRAAAAVGKRVRISLEDTRVSA